MIFVYFAPVAADDTQLQQQDQREAVLIDLRSALAKIIYEPSADKFKVEQKNDEVMVPLLEQFEENQPGQTYISGNALTFLDFVFYEVPSRLNLMFQGEITQKFPHLSAYLQTMDDLKGIKEYTASGKQFAQIYDSSANWGGESSSIQKH